MKKTSLQKGFTLIETLVAITILMIAIAGPLSISSKAFTAAIDAKNQAIAMNLAQEGIEYLNNLKDNGRWPPGNNGCVENAPVCGVGFSGVTNSNDVIEYGKCADMNLCRLYLNQSIGYTHRSVNADATPFYRKFYLKQIAGQVDQYMAVVEVSWNTGLKNSSIVLQELLTNVMR